MGAISGFKPKGRVELRNLGAPLHSCPKCNADTDLRVKNAKFIDRYFYWMSLKKYQCMECQHQFYIMAR